MLREFQGVFNTLVGKSIVGVRYFEREREETGVFGPCDVCEFGIELDLSGNGTCTLMRLPWVVDFNEPSIFMGEGRVTEWRPGETPPIEALDVSHEARWKPFLHNPITAIDVFDNDLDKENSLNLNQLGEWDMPDHLRLTFSSSERLYIYSGNYQPSYGYERNGWDTLVIVFGEAARRVVFEKRIYW